MKKIFFLLLIIFTTSCKGKIETELFIIPQPNEQTRQNGYFTIPAQLSIFSNMHTDDKERILSYLDTTPFKSDILLAQEVQASLSFIIEENDSLYQSSESYILDVSEKRISIKAKRASGLFYGLQTLIQLYDNGDGKSIPSVSIKDTPRFRYRGLMIDVSRHFFSKEYIKRQLDMMSRYKLNTLHWHLTDGTAWRIEIKKYPQLTEQTAWRPIENFREWTNAGQPYCTKDTQGAYGGYYTQEDIKEIIAYATDRNITIIPEIELPGHSHEVLAAFPNLSCYGVSHKNSEFCIGNEESFTFLENVLSEVVELFPSQFIHIGGDEADKTAWDQCPKCKKRIAQENLTDVDQLQSYMIHRIEKYLSLKGRSIIGWDEILEGGLSPNATVMSWRGETGGIKSSEMGHNVIMTPNSHCYFDSYQDAPTTQPEAMSGFLPIDKVYSYDPLGSFSDSIKKYVIGVQANLWTEYVPDEKHADYMLWPRLLALSEIAWTNLEMKSLLNFHRRALVATDDLKKKGYHPFDLKNEIGIREESKTGIKHKAFDKRVTYNTMFSPKYVASGESTFTDGLRGGWSYSDGNWQGFLETDIDVIIELDSVKTIHLIKATFMQDYLGWIWMPSEVEIYGSNDGSTFTLLERIVNDLPIEQGGFSLKDFEWKGEQDVKAIRMLAKQSGRTGGWLFTDEIIVE